jgi:heptosyltransferase III
MIAPDARVLVIAVTRIGDTLLITPALRALKRAAPQGTLTCLAHPKRLEVLEHLPFLDELAPTTKYRAWWRGRIGGKRYDYALVYGHDDALIRFADRVAERVIAFEQRVPALNACLFRVVPPSTAHVHAVTERLLLVDALGVAADDLRLAYRVSDGEREWAQARVRKFAPEPAVRIGLQLMSFPTKAYRDWPLDNYLALADQLQRALPQVHFALFGDQRGHAPAEKFRARFPDRTTNLAGALSLRESAAIMAQLHLYIGIDTGPSHLAGAVGIPMVVMYHWRHPGKFLAPLEHPAPLHIIEHPGPDTMEGMGAIGVEQVWQEVQKILPQLGDPTRLAGHARTEPQR